MSTNSHLSALEERHKELKATIEKQRLYPSQDTLRLSDLKRQKLMIKDEINQLNQ